MTTETLLPAGAKLAHFEIRREIGGGAMGTVYEAWDTSLDRAVAVKVLRDRIAHDAGVVDRFFREARAAARVNHPNLTHIYFVGREDGRPFFAMEYVPGVTLEALVASKGPVPLGDAIELLSQAARGLAAAHAGGVIHRDVKPSNLIRRDDGVLKVADFGLAKSMDADVHATGGGSLMGTPTFMSPEQCRGRDVGVQSDVYALGLVAWFVLVGRPPYTATSLGELLSDQINTPLPSAVSARPDLPPATDEVLRRLCAKDPAERPATMAEVERLLDTLRPRRIAVAAFFPRASAHLVDLAVGCVAASAVALLLAGTIELLEDTRFRWIASVFSFAGSMPVRLLSSAAAALALLLPELWHQTSVGKYFFELTVVREDGTRPGPLAYAGRFVLRYPFLVVLPLTVIPDIRFGVVAAAVALQVLAELAGIGCHIVRGGRTLSDVVTKTTVAYRRGGG